MSGLKGCLTSGKFTMLATILRQNFATADAPVNTGAYYEVQQDPISGAVKRNWVASDPDVVTVVTEDIPCMVEGIVDGGIRVAGTTERFSNVYENIDWARMTFPKNVMISKRDRITNVRNALTGEIIWKEEELSTLNSGQYSSPATTFDVLGVTPITNPYGQVTEYVALLQRAEVFL